jgi:hypothetical protein
MTGKRDEMTYNDDWIFQDSREQQLAEALRLIDVAFRLAERSTPANLRRAIVAARDLMQETR